MRGLVRALYNMSTSSYGVGGIADRIKGIGSRVRGVANRIVGSVRNFYQRLLGYKLPEFPGYEVAELPTIYRIWLVPTRTGYKLYITARKILGMYIPWLKKIVIDPTVKKSKELKENVLAHEYAHYVQHVLGLLGKYPREFIEGMADYLADLYLRGKGMVDRVNSYLQEKHAFERVLGMYGSLKRLLNSNPEEVSSNFYRSYGLLPTI
ncbi:MAG: hypothetical protein J7K98_03460 [Candidatus Aenigmarchaeota archaeon]|nr:hypothetical protein [Candidatus Aenigmarchaeota archaeon]